MELYKFFSSPIFLVVLFLATLFTIFDLYEFIKSFIKKQDIRMLAADIFQVHLSFKTAKIIIVIIDLVLAIAVILGSNQFWLWYGKRDIVIMPSGTYCYYVYATNEKGQTYTLPANIEKINNNTYCVYNVYFKNGGYLYFYDCEYFDFEDTEYVIDQNGKGWHIELTNEKTTHPKVEETEPIKPFGLVLPITVCALYLLSVLFHIIHLIQHYNINRYKYFPPLK
ncbi:MAG: hypothetical protein J6C27_00860 [Clostridia bacterium]|nr:hypothetical protein [Clostridia bacterium]